jgi:hypothetical protein
VPALLGTMPRRSRLGLWKLLQASEQQSMAQGAFHDGVEAFDELSNEFCSESWFSGSAMIVSSPASLTSSCPQAGSGSGAGSMSTFMPELQWFEDPSGQQVIALEDAAEAGVNVRVISRVLAVSKSETAACHKDRTRAVRAETIACTATQAVVTRSVSKLM